MATVDEVNIEISELTRRLEYQKEFQVTVGERLARATTDYQNSIAKAKSLKSQADAARPGSEEAAWLLADAKSEFNFANHQLNNSVEPAREDMDNSKEAVAALTTQLAAAKAKLSTATSVSKIDPPTPPNEQPLSAAEEKNLASDKPAGEEVTPTSPVSPQDSVKSEPSNSPAVTAEGAATPPKPDVVTQDSDTPVYKPTENFLHNFASYTYNLSLHALTMQQYNDLSASQVSANKLKYTPENVLIAGAGRRSDTFKRNEHFNADFYFDDFKMTTVIGLNTRSRMTNAVDFNFTIIEPYGVTLLNRIIVMASQLGCDNYVSMPYLIQLDFFGYADDGVPVKLQGVSKYFPVKIVALKFKVGTKGATYQIQAIPFNHQAYSDTIMTCPANFLVEGANIADFFRSDDSSVDSNSVANGITERNTARDTLIHDTQVLSSQRMALAVIEQRKKGKTLEPGDLEREEVLNREIAETERRVRIAEKQSEDTNSRRINIKSFTNGFNAWLVDLESTKQQTKSDRIKFSIDPVIAAANIEYIETQQSQNAAMNYSKDKKPTDKVTGPIVGSKAIEIPMGMSIIDVITKAILNSSYIRGQVSDPLFKELSNTKDATNAADKLGKALDWFKITSTIKLGQFDPLRREYAKTITYHISHMKVYNTTNPLAPKGLPVGVAKVYQYMFTGQNRDVLDFDIDFDAAYYVAMSANRINASAGREVQKEGVESPAAESEAVKEIKESGNPLSPVVTAVTTQGDVAGDPKSIAVKDLMRNLLSTSKGDMINVRLKIIGDPDFIKQDDLFYSVDDVSSNAAVHKTDNASLIMDQGDIHAYLLFKTPVDYNDQGLAKPEKESLYSVSIFSGVYKVLTVDSEFRNGAFVQTLDLIRLHDQKIEGLDGILANYSYANAAERKESDSKVTPNTETDSRTGGLALPEMPGNGDALQALSNRLPNSNFDLDNGINSIKVMSDGAALPLISQGINDVSGGITVTPKLPGISQVGADIGSIPRLGPTPEPDIQKSFNEDTFSWMTVPINKDTLNGVQ